VGEADAVTENATDVMAGEPPVETGNYPDPWDGPQDHLDQTPEPQFDEHLVDGADYEGGS
jgi:hypothetical protein